MLLVAAHVSKTITYVYCNISMRQDGVNTLNYIGILHHLRCPYLPYSNIHTFHGSKFASMTVGCGINHKHGGLKSSVYTVKHALTITFLSRTFIALYKVEIYTLATGNGRRERDLKCAALWEEETMVVRSDLQSVPGFVTDKTIRIFGSAFLLSELTETWDGMTVAQKIHRNFAKANRKIC